MPIQSLITQRISIRNFHPEPAPLAVLEALRLAGEQAEALTPVEMRFHLCAAGRINKDIKGILGDYGKTIHAPHFMVLASREGYLTDAGRGPGV